VRSILRVVLVTLVILSVADFFKSIITSLTHLFFLIVLSIFFAYLIEPLVQMIRRPFEVANRDNYMPRPVAIAAAYLIVFSTLGVAIAVLTPLVNAQLRQLTTNLPTYSSALQRQFRDLSNRYERYRIPEAVQEQINTKAADVAAAIGTGVTEFFISLATYLPWLILIPILAFFFLKDANLFRVSILRVFPSGDWRARMESIIHDVNTTLAAYTRAQLISCIVIGTICTCRVLSARRKLRAAARRDGGNSGIYSADRSAHNCNCRRHHGFARINLGSRLRFHILSRSADFARLSFLPAYRPRGNSSASAGDYFVGFGGRTSGGNSRRFPFDSGRRAFDGRL
jgi:hypothetical protein